MQHDDEAVTTHGCGSSQEAFLGSFSRVPSGLDPTQVYSHFLKMSARIRQLEEQARRVSAPFLLEAAMREATEARTQAAHAAERAYNEIVDAAQQEADRARNEARREAERVREEALTVSTALQHEGQAMLEQARQEASRLRQEAEDQQAQSDQELEQICVEFAGFLQRMLDRRKSALTSETEPTSDGPSPRTGASLSSTAVAAELDPAVGPAAPHNAATPLNGSAGADSVDASLTTHPSEAAVAANDSPEQAPDAAVEAVVNTAEPTDGSQPRWPTSSATDRASLAGQSVGTPSESAPGAGRNGTHQELTDAPGSDPSPPQKQNQRGGFRLPDWLDL